ncbi:hypothetical protein [Methylocystis sp.]
MSAPANAAKGALFIRLWRIGLACCALRASRAFDEFAEWLLPEDLRRQP